MNIAYDKKLHLLAGLLVSLVTVIAGWPMLAWLSCLVAGVGKEVYDKITNILAVNKGDIAPHSVDQADVVYTVLPGIATTVLWLIASLAGMV